MEPIRWENGTLYLLDQRQLPGKTEWMQVHDYRQVVDAIAAHDSDAAREYMYRHLSGNLASITEQEQLQMKEKKTRRPAKTKQ